jgi:hypothetical protein
MHYPGGKLMGSILDDIGKIFEDVTGVVGDVVAAGASLFDGPGGVIGVFTSGAALIVGGPGALVPAIVAGIAVTEGVNALIKTRRLSAEERTLAEMVFGTSLPPYDRIILTNLYHPQGRAFVIPNAAGECLVNLGDAYHDPIRHTSPSYPEYGQMLIHELTHTWQIHHSSFVPGLICEGIINQVKHEIEGVEGGVYSPGDGKRGWSEYNLEQQATIVDRWYGTGWGAGPCSARSHAYPSHIRDAVNGGAAPPVVQPLSVRTVARRKFGTEGGFSVQTRFPRHVHGHRSLRKSLIGLRNQN